MHLTSPHNPFLQTIRRAAAHGRPTEDGLIIAEGPHLLEEALRGKWRIEQVLVTREAQERYHDLIEASHAEVIELSARAFAGLSATETTQQVLALLRPPRWEWTDLVGEVALVIILDGIQDPGNAGAIVRSAEAFGATGLIFLKGAVRIANGKLLRATAGSLFRLPFLEAVGPPDLIPWLRSSKLKLYALSASAHVSLTDTDLRMGCALAVGSEGAGLSAEISTEATSIRVPTRNVESLNAAIACSIALFAAAQQRHPV